MSLTPVEQRAPGLLLAGCDFDQARNTMGPTYGLTHFLTHLFEQPLSSAL
jgi:hypothetical protein